MKMVGFREIMFVAKPVRVKGGQFTADLRIVFLYSLFFISPQVVEETQKGLASICRVCNISKLYLPFFYKSDTEGTAFRIMFTTCMFYVYVNCNVPVLCCKI